MDSCSAPFIDFSRIWDFKILKQFLWSMEVKVAKSQRTCHIRTKTRQVLELTFFCFNKFPCFTFLRLHQCILICMCIFFCKDEQWFSLAKHSFSLHDCRSHLHEILQMQLVLDHYSVSHLSVTDFTFSWPFFLAL